MKGFIFSLLLLSLLLCSGCGDEVVSEESEVVVEETETIVTEPAVADSASEIIIEEIEPEVEEEPEVVEEQVDTNKMEEAEEKMTDMIVIFKDLRNYITELKQKEGDFDDAIAEAELIQESARDVRDQAEKDFADGKYEDAIRNAEMAIDIADKYVDIENDE